jgi:hypothetical protein
LAQLITIIIAIGELNNLNWRNMVQLHTQALKVKATLLQPLLVVSSNSFLGGILQRLKCSEKPQEREGRKSTGWRVAAESQTAEPKSGFHVDQ